MLEENEVTPNEPTPSSGQNSQKYSRAALGFTVAGLGIGGMLAYLISRNARAAKRRGSTSQHLDENVVDDQGTSQDEATQILRNLRDRGFNSSDEELALALGRTGAEVDALISGREIIDDDVMMKARGIAMHRGIRVD